MTNHPFRSLFAAHVVMAIYASPAVRAELTLVDAGATKATLVVAAQPSDQTTEAAHALRDYVEKISGAKLVIARENEAVKGTRILVGPSQAVRDLGVEVPSGSDGSGAVAG